MAWERVRRWYEGGLGWETAPGIPVRLRTGVRFDVLDVPAEAGHASLRRLGAHAPVALRGDRMMLLVAAGSAEELPGLLRWLEWGSLPLDLSASGAGGLMEAPLPCRADGLVTEAAPCRADGLVTEAAPCRADGAVPCRAGLAGGVVPGGGWQGAAVWLRPPVPGSEVEASLPALSAVGALGGVGGAPGRAPDLVRLVDTVATHCHRVRLRGAGPPRSQGCR
ncbi:SCO3374 family protein [Streptomyces sp. ISL-12]|uniref:SCO3374 family protein n=1 Tax=Streptomyces sp. ISL-12 TaxID=2819177 RepID=UPI0027E1F294|nr:SCO3374 family protein [Streptomyces sp. ISL-12]